MTRPYGFAALTRDGRLGQADSWIDEEIANNRFVIGSDTPGVKVSWLVTGIRNDTYARESPIIVERDKDTEFDELAVADRDDQG